MINKTPCSCIILQISFIWKLTYKPRIQQQLDLGPSNDHEISTAVVQNISNISPELL